MNRLTSILKILILVFKNAPFFCEMIEKNVNKMPELSGQFKRAGEKLIETSYILDGEDGREVSIKKIADDLIAATGNIYDLWATWAISQNQVSEQLTKLTIPIPTWTTVEKDVFNLGGLIIGKVTIPELKIQETNIMDAIPQKLALLTCLQIHNETLVVLMEKFSLSNQRLSQVSEMASGTGESIRITGNISIAMSEVFSHN